MHVNRDQILSCLHFQPQPEGEEESPLKIVLRLDKMDQLDYYLFNPFCHRVLPHLSIFLKLFCPCDMQVLTCQSMPTLIISKYICVRMTLIMGELVSRQLTSNSYVLWIYLLKLIPLNYLLE